MINKIIRKFQANLKSDMHLLELIKGTSTAFILKITGIITGYIFTLIVTRTFGAKAWGSFALSLVVLQITSIIGRLGTDIALLKFTAEHVAKLDLYNLKKIYQKTLTLVVPLSTLIAIFTYSLSPMLTNKIFHKPYLINYFRIASFAIIPFTLLWIHSECIRGLKKIKEYMLLQQPGIFTITIGIFLIGFFLTKSPLLPIISYTISILILTTASIYLWNRYLYSLNLSPFTYCSSHKNLASSVISYRFILSTSLPLLLSSSLSLIMNWTDTVMLGMFRSGQEVGIYNIALKVSSITSITLIAINTIAAPKFAEFWGKRDIKGLTNIAKQSTKLIFWTSFPVLLIILVFPESILGIFGNTVKKGVNSLIILTLGQFINAISGSVGYILIMTGFQNFYQFVLLMGAFLNIILNLLLIPKYGMEGAAMASSISLIFWNIFFSIKVKNILGEFIFFKP